METPPVTRKHTPLFLRPKMTRLTGCLLLAAVSGMAMPRAIQAQPADYDPKAEKEKIIREAAEAEKKKLMEAKQADEVRRQEASGRARATPQPGTVVTPKGTQAATPVPGVNQPGGAPGAAGGTGAQPKSPVVVTAPPGGAPAKGGGNGAAAAGQQEVKADEIALPAFADAVQLRELIELVAATLQINVVAPDTLSGSIVLVTPMVVKKAELLKLLDALLEQHGYTISHDVLTGFYRVSTLDGVPMTLDGGDMATTKVIQTPSIRPSSLSDIISAQVGVMASTGAQPGGVPGGGGRGRMNFLDDLGVIIVTDSPRRIELIERIVGVVMKRAAEQEFMRFDLTNVAATAARSRILELVGKSSTGLGIAPPAVPGQPGAIGGQSNTNFDNLSDRLTVDPQSNALILRGYKDEEEKIKSLLLVLDRPTQAEYKQYFAGSAAQQIAQLAERFGLGATETVETMSQNQTQGGGVNPQNNLRNQAQNPLAGIQGLNGQQTVLGGPVLVVDPSRGTITYNGTAAQQETVAKLIKAFNPELEVVEFKAYKIKNMKAPEMADLLTGLIFNEEVTRSESTSFLPGGGSRRGSGSSYRNNNSNSSSINSQFNQQQSNNTNRTGTRGTRNPTRTGTSGNGGGGNTLRSPLAFQNGEDQPPDSITSISTQDVFVMADEANNQVVVKATARDHKQIEKLIAKLDQRRPQVYIDVQIVSVSANDDFRLAVELQGINAGGKGGAANLNFGLGSLTALNAAKSVSTGLPGLTAAVINTDQVPIVMTALKRNTDTRILSSPQLLVDDNEHAEIVSLDEQPTTGSNIGTSTTTNTFTDYVSAGTTLAVTPSISEAGYMRLEYEIELSNFVGTSSTAGIPPPKQTRNVSSYVTVPGNATVIVGGITVDSMANTVAKVPLLGDIPIIKWLFRDNSKSHQSTRLYIFITPRIMRDVNFGDVGLLTKGPARDAGIELGMPDLKPVAIEMNDAPPTFMKPSAKVEGKAAEDPPAAPQETPAAPVSPGGEKR